MSFKDSNISFLLLSIIVLFQGIMSEDPIVETNVGTIRGVRVDDGNYSMYLGIPFARVDMDNPFGPSSPYPRFEGVFDAIDDSVVCPQIEEFNKTIVGSLDCLNLNVYVPDTASVENPAAVMIWIHGGGYAIGFASKFIHGPKFFVRHDVILVSLNYRLGPYGFMCVDTPEVPGNQGLKDQLIALRWVRDNIAEFGGDLDRITLFGESAGSVAIDLHIVSEHETLYNRVIMQSGTGYNPRSLRTPVTTSPIAIASKLGEEYTDVHEALAYISTVDPHDIIAAASQTDITFRPGAEKDFANVEKFVRDYRLNIESVPKAENMSILMGFNNDEFLLSFIFLTDENYQNLDEFRDRLNVSFNFNNDKLEEATKFVRTFYMGDEEYSQAVRQDITDFASDFQYVYPTQRGLKNYLDNGAEKAYYYVFSYSGNRNFVKRRNGVVIGGAAHADELGYLFDMEIFPEQPTEEDQLIIDRMTTLWTNFAKYGDPTPVTTALLPVKWEPVTKGSPYHYLNITLDMQLSTRPFQRRLTFWDLFYQTYGEYEAHFRMNRQSNLLGNLMLTVALPLCLNMINIP